MGFCICPCPHSFGGRLVPRCPWLYLPTLQMLLALILTSSSQVMSLQKARLPHAGGQGLYLLLKSRVLMRVQAGGHCLSTGSPVMKWSLPREGVWLVHSLFASSSDPYTGSDNLFFTHSKSRTAAPARGLSCVGVWVIL